MKFKVNILWIKKNLSDNSPFLWYTEKSASTVSYLLFFCIFWNRSSKATEIPISWLIFGYFTLLFGGCKRSLRTMDRWKQKREWRRCFDERVRHVCVCVHFAVRLSFSSIRRITFTISNWFGNWRLFLFLAEQTFKQWRLAILMATWI